MKALMQRLTVLSVSTFLLSGTLFAGMSVAADTQTTASEDAQHGEVAKEPPITPSPTDSNSLKPPAAIAPTSIKEEASANKNTTFSDEDIKAFVEAAKSVDQLKLKYEGELSKANGQAAIDQIKKEADLALSKTVTEKGMSVAQYNKIQEAALKDPQLQDRIQKQL
jgi:hypothetical protein